MGDRKVWIQVGKNLYQAETFEGKKMVHVFKK
jgi:hypothetical protein